MDEVIQSQACTGFDVSPDGKRFRLRLVGREGQPFMVEFPATGLASLMKTLPEIQQVALPRQRGNNALRVIRRPEAWTLERDMADESLLLVLIAGGLEWCFNLYDEEV